MDIILGSESVRRRLCSGPHYLLAVLGWARLFVTWKIKTKNKTQTQTKHKESSGCPWTRSLSLACLRRGRLPWILFPASFSSEPLLSLCHLWIYPSCFQDVWCWSVVEENMQTSGSQTWVCIPALCLSELSFLFCKVRAVPRLIDWYEYHMGFCVRSIKQKVGTHIRLSLLLSLSLFFKSRYGSFSASWPWRSQLHFQLCFPATYTSLLSR